MFKYLFCSLLIFFLLGIEPAFSQTGADSSATGENHSENSYLPKEDTGYLPKGPTRVVSAKQINVYMRNPDYIYANDPEYWKKRTPAEPGLINKLLSSVLFRWIVFISVIGIAMYGVYLLAKENSFSWLVHKRQQSRSDTSEVRESGEMDYDHAIRKCQEEGNYRSAIRYMYLRLIRTAGEKNGIPFRDSSTNTEIARTFGNHPMADEFRFLSMVYEYIFYGGFLPEKELYDSLKNKFEVFQQTLAV
jgi:hypothetical protein